MAGSVGIAGSALLLGFQPDMLPTPSLAMAFSAFDDLHNATAEPYLQGGSRDAAALLGGFASPETVESGIWISSVLFCCCVCLGNIGRRLLALTLHGSSSAPARGRWSFQWLGEGDYLIAWLYNQFCETITMLEYPVPGTVDDLLSQAHDGFWGRLSPSLHLFS
jgi:hypothetical protein